MQSGPPAGDVIFMLRRNGEGQRQPVDHLTQKHAKMSLKLKTLERRDKIGFFLAGISTVYAVLSAGLGGCTVGHYLLGMAAGAGD